MADVRLKQVKLTNQHKCLDGMDKHESDWFALLVFPSN